MPQLRCPHCGTMYEVPALDMAYQCPTDGVQLVPVYPPTPAFGAPPFVGKVTDSDSVDDLEVVGSDDDVDNLEVLTDSSATSTGALNSPHAAQAELGEFAEAEPIDPLPMFPASPYAYAPPAAPAGAAVDPVPETPAMWDQSRSGGNPWDSSSQAGHSHRHSSSQPGGPTGPPATPGLKSKQPTYRVPPPVSQMGGRGSAAHSDGGKQMEGEPKMPPASRIPGVQEEIPVGPFGEFIIRRELGRGAMGIVYLADWPAHNMRVAFKVLAMKKTEEPRHRKRFMREATICLNLDHPNLVKVYQVGEHQGRCYMAMELIEGQPLSSIITERGTLTAPEVVPYLVQTLGGCEVFHQAGIIHRDIKPDNILIRNDGVAKLTDFGLARIAGPEISKLTAAGKAVGTPYFMAPEQILHPDEVDHRVDIYAYGVSLYYALTAAYPYDGRKPNDVLLNIARQQPIHIWTRRPDVPQSVALVTMKFLARDPNQRYPNATAAAAALAQALQAI